MAKRTIDFSDYEGQQYDEYQGEDPPAGKWFTAEVVRGKYIAEDDQMVWYVQIVDDDIYAGWTRGWYAPFEGTTKWKAQEFARAIQGTEKPISFDPEKELDVANVVKKAKRIKIRTGEYNDRINIRTVRPLLEKAGGPTPAKAAAPAPAATEEAIGESLEDYTAEELEGMEATELAEILKEEFEVDPPAKGRRESADAYKTKLVEAILEAQESDAPDAVASADEEGSEPYTEDELAEKDDAELVAILKDEFSIDAPKKGRRESAETYSDKLIDTILDAQDATSEEGIANPDQPEGDFDEGFAETEPEPEPEPAPRTRRAKAAAPAAEPAKATTSRRRRA